MQLYLGELKDTPTDRCGDSLRKSILGKKAEVEWGSHRLQGKLEKNFLIVLVVS